MRQGCILSPTLFSLYIKMLTEGMIRVNARERKRVGEEKICMLLCTNDLLVMNECTRAATSIRCGRGLWKRF